MNSSSRRTGFRLSLLTLQQHPKCDRRKPVLLALEPFCIGKWQQTGGAR
jgi:hypothetical protein